MTQTQLKNGIINKLKCIKEKIGMPNITIYDETVKQGFKEPCFFIQFLINTHRHLIGNRYERLNSVEILYFSNKDNSKEDYDYMVEQLLEELKYIYVEEDTEHPIRATGDIIAEVVDNVLHITVDYNYHLLTTSEKVKMNYKEQGVDVLDE